MTYDGGKAFYKPRLSILHSSSQMPVMIHHCKDNRLKVSKSFLPDCTGSFGRSTYLAALSCSAYLVVAAVAAATVSTATKRIEL
jgi:hypothetical protein